MTDETLIDWDDAFANAAYIPDGASYPERWAQDAAAFRAQARARLDLPYGEAPREGLDLFLPDAAPLGLMVFVHGGFWLAFDKSHWSHFGSGALARGWAVAMPSYTLAPEMRIAGMTRQIAQAVARAGQEVSGPIRLCGHSAGGHLVSRMACADAPLPDAVATRIDRVVSVSGLHDLRPLMRHSMNDRLQLDAAEARAESPALNAPRGGVRLTAWVGAAERPEFLRQSALLAESWSRQGAQISLVAEPGRHHFDVLDGLRDSDHPLTRAVLDG
ncbi:Acetyl esterase/lipase [Paracoccus isoporae]|uniref:Acetyl esterase/lipase n=1 Tax=Paracoccus isoporae TaxID=591205 RepID=A0A1G7FAL2_9RHOB|nr:alpha/beta hydrolase [Paracoccus isoporae]SDE72926.1 Acetyl esterase/lipase [Paracoccus isoporae]